MSNTPCDKLDETQVPAKKLKQARLVFKPLTPPSAKKDNTQKRKFTEIDDDIEIIEDTNKDDAKENKKTVENGTIEPKETAVKKKKLSASDDESNTTKEEKAKDANLKDKKNVESKKKPRSVQDVNLKAEEDVKTDTDAAKKQETQSEVTETTEPSEKNGNDFEKTQAPEKSSSSGSESGKKAEDEIEIVCLELDEKSSDSTKTQSIVDHRDESNEEDKKSKDDSIMSGISEDALNVSPSSVKEPPLPSVRTPATEKKIPKPRKLTPKQLEKQQEREKIRLEKEKKKAEELEVKLKLKREKEELKRKEQEEKEKLKREKEELKKKEQEEKKKLEEQKRKEKEEKEKRRLAEIEQKNEEKLRREEEKRKMEEEKQKQEELKQQKEKKAKAAFAKFFVNKPKTDQSAKMEVETEFAPTDLAFMPFQEKPFMKLAPVTRVTLSSEQLTALEDAIAKAPDSNTKGLYLDQIKSTDYQKGTSGKTWPNEEEDDILIVEDDDDVKIETETSIDSKRKLMRAKLLQFHENHRPPYYGTWRKMSKTIKPRNPCQKDDVHFDYEVDSDDEWEEGEGESLRGSDDEKESEDDYEVDNDIFVPHGYLSDEEVQEEEDAEDMNPEAQKLKLKLLGEEFEAELHEKTERLKPVLVGPMWINNNVEETTCVDSRIVKYLMPRRAVWKERSPISTTESIGADETSPEHPSSAAKSSHNFSEEEIKSLIRLVHGSIRNRRLLAKEFLLLLESQSSSASLTAINRKLKEIATYQVCPSNEGLKLLGRKCWFVTPEIRAQYGLSELLASDNPHVANMPDYSPAPTPDSAAAITKFTKVLSEEERLKQLVEIVPDHKHQNGPQASPGLPSSSLITKYTKVLSEEECLKQLASPLSDKTPKSCDKAPKSPSIMNFLKTPKSDSPSSAASSSPISSRTPQSLLKEKKRLPLLASVKVGEEIPDAVRPSCALSQAKPAENKKQSIKEAIQTVPAEPIPMEADCLLSVQKPLSVAIAPMTNTVTPSTSASSGNITSSSSAKTKKRVPLLVSVKRGEQIPLSVRPSATLSILQSTPPSKVNPIAGITAKVEKVAQSNDSKLGAKDVECVMLDSD